MIGGKIPERRDLTLRQRALQSFAIPARRPRRHLAVFRPGGGSRPVFASPAAADGVGVRSPRRYCRAGHCAARLRAAVLGSAGPPLPDTARHACALRCSTVGCFPAARPGAAARLLPRCRALGGAVARCGTRLWAASQVPGTGRRGFTPWRSARLLPSCQAGRGGSAERRGARPRAVPYCSRWAGSRGVPVCREPPPSRVAESSAAAGPSPARMCSTSSSWLRALAGSASQPARTPVISSAP